MRTHTHTQTHTVAEASEEKKRRVFRWIKPNENLYRSFPSSFGFPRRINIINIPGRTTYGRFFSTLEPSNAALAVLSAKTMFIYKRVVKV